MKLSTMSYLNSRVYIMEGREGPGKVLEQEAHSERVDSIQWSNNPRLKFVSGSKDGTARIWSFRSGCWNSSVLKVTASDGRTVIFNKEIIDSDDTYYYITPWRIGSIRPPCGS